jgi:hypothetical protein
MNKKIIEEAKELINNLTAIEDRHLLELIAVKSGLKKVMRIHISNSTEYRLLELFCKRNSLHLAHSQFRLKLSWANQIGDRFYSDVPWEDQSAEEFIAYLTKNDLEALSKSVWIERDGNNIEAGKLYGYPDCCCRNYETIANGEDWLDVLSKTSRGTFFSPWANKLSYLVHGFTLFPDYFPCSYNCKQTAELSKKYFKLGNEVGLGDFVKMQLELMSRTYLIEGENVLSFSEWFIDTENVLHLEKKNMSIFGENNLEDYSDNKILISLPNNSTDCFWKWNKKNYRVFVFTDDPGIEYRP